MATLDLLLPLAEARQVILFSQETAVQAWAEHHLTPPRHAVQHLPRPVPVV